MKCFFHKSIIKLVLLLLIFFYKFICSSFDPPYWNIEAFVTEYCRTSYEAAQCKYIDTLFTKVSLDYYYYYWFSTLPFVFPFIPNSVTWQPLWPNIVEPAMKLPNINIMICYSLKCHLTIIIITSFLHFHLYFLWSPIL